MISTLRPDKRVIAFLEEEGDPVLHLLAACGERSGAHGEKAMRSGSLCAKAPPGERAERDEPTAGSDRKAH